VGGPRGAGVLIGRQAELAVLDELIAQTAAGAGGAVLLTGDPGVGKTRLAREATQRAAGAMVPWGGCRESEGAPPLWPWLQVLRVARS
jgi:predicted ATPase